MKLKNNFGKDGHITVFYAFIHTIGAIAFLYISILIFKGLAPIFWILFYIGYLSLKVLYKGKFLYIGVGRGLTYMIWIIVWANFAEYYPLILYDITDTASIIEYIGDIVIATLIGMVLTYFIGGLKFVLYYYIYFLIFLLIYFFL